jgi:hypothetical protein
MKELNMMDMANVNGGVDWAKVFGFSWTSGMGAAAIASIAVCALSGPIGWGAAAVVAGTGAAAAAVGGGITAAVTAND